MKWRSFTGRIRMNGLYNNKKITGIKWKKSFWLPFMLFILIAAGGGYMFVKSAAGPVNPGSKKTVEVNIPFGSDLSAIAEMLEDQGIIKNSFVFKLYVKLKSNDGFQAGKYTLSPSMTYDDIIKNLQQGGKPALTILVPEGLQLKEIASIIAEHTKYKEEEIIERLNNEDVIKKLMEKYPRLLTDEILHKDIKFPLEGYLYPATYHFYEQDPSLETIITAMLDKTAEMVEKYRPEMEEKGMTVHELLTFASLIEEEASEKSDRKKISSVFYNRLEIGMPLQTDPTVIYALGEHRERLTFRDYYEVEDPFNTYLNKELPPGPIANSGEMSIEAALHPADSEYLYFLATPEGEVLFSKTLDEHNEKYDEHIKRK